MNIDTNCNTNTYAKSHIDAAIDTDNNSKAITNGNTCTNVGMDILDAILY